MRVAVVTLETAHSTDTARTRRLDRLSRQLVEAGNHVVVCCDQWWDGNVSTFEHDGVHYRAVTSDGSVRKFAARIPFSLRRIKPDIVHASYWPPIAAVGAAAGRWIGRTPVAVDWYGDVPIDTPSRMVQRAIRSPTVLTTPSKYIETSVRERGARADRIRVIPDSIDINRIRDQPAADRPDIVTARHLDEEANVDMMLLGLAELRDRDWSAMVIGDGPALDYYRRKAAELRIDDRVDFPGDLPIDVRIGHYKAAHVFIQTAERCPFPLELLRALACGCVGIVDYQESSAAHELVETFDRGFRTTDPEELSQAIIEAGELPELTYHDGFESYRHDRILEQFLDLYDGMLS